MAEAKKILIIDDETDVITYLTTFFDDNGFNTISAVNGKDGVKRAVEENPDIITLDVSMPEESGVKALRELQENEVTKNTPVILVTGVSLDFKRFIETRKQVHAPEGYFEKPIDRDKLLEKVKELLKI
ncbi:MAG: response regulator [Ignavibacteria bacterium]|nr:response regulator [Ignavibacteria bacterium]MBT8393012.1 response regulator [Ignavibacteria bacterium]NNJ52114.1 response regulator [Ignavibacteriaceae bacterium]NNL19797.1 response regulator [Ignavibacteriaceae bacterium]